MLFFQFYPKTDSQLSKIKPQHLRCQSFSLKGEFSGCSQVYNLIFLLDTFLVFISFDDKRRQDPGANKDKP